MKLCLTMDNDVRPGFMIPVPQYPLYSACTAEFNAQLVSCFFSLTFLSWHSADIYYE